jgi:poly(A) polymerase
MDDLEDRIEALAEAEELAALRPELDGKAVMDHLGLTPGRDIGEALSFLLEIRLEEGLIGEDESKARLNTWWAQRSS